MTGFAQGFETGLDGAIKDRVVQIGAGGAGRAIAFALSELGVGELILADIRVAVQQAVDAFELFSGQKADPDRMRETFLSYGT